MIRLDFQAFLIDRQSSNLSKNTIAYYKQELEIFTRFLEESDIYSLDYVTSDVIRKSMLILYDHRSPGGVHAYYRAVKAFLNWYEYENDGWINPIKRVKPPRLNHVPLPGITPDEIRRILATCEKGFYDLRDRAILTFLYDTGARVNEAVCLNYSDINLETGAVLIQHGKGNKTRVVFMGIKCRREIIKYLRLRENLFDDSPLFVRRDGVERISRSGISSMILQRLNKAGITSRHSPHDFRRAFTKKALEATDVVTVARLLGHSDTSLVWRYFHQNNEDLRRAHARASPGDKL